VSVTETGREESRNGLRIYCAQPVGGCAMLRDFVVVGAQAGMPVPRGAALESDERDGLSMAWLLLGHAVECAQAQDQVATRYAYYLAVREEGGQGVEG
jgi:hypothetical protein